MTRNLIPLGEGSKAPAVAGVSWKSLMTDDEREHERWRCRGWNCGMVTGRPNGIVVRDYDKAAGLALARIEFQERREFFKCLVSTPSGGLHVYLREPSFHVPNAVKVNGQSVDLKSNEGYVAYVGSKFKGKPYSFIPGYELGEVDDLPVFPEIWLPPVAKSIAGITRGDIGNVLAYAMKVESFQGNGGSKGLVRLAAICRDEGYSESETLLVLQHWNKGPTVNPPWSDTELARAATNVFKKGKKK